MILGDPQWYALVQDDGLQNFVVPVDKLDLWYDWVDRVIDGDQDRNDWPVWAIGVDSRGVEFTEWRRPEGYV